MTPLLRKFSYHFNLGSVAISLFLLLLLLGGSQNAKAGFIRVQGNVSGHWTADTIFVSGDILVPEGSTLQIDPGAVIVFEGMYGLTIEGNVEARGTADQFIHFTGADTAGFSGAHKLTGGWKGILAKSKDLPSIFSYVRFTYMDGQMPIKLDIFKSTFDHCFFDHNQGIYLLGFSRSSNQIKNCVFTQNWVGTSVIFMEGFYQDTASFNNNTIAYNQGRALFNLGYFESVLNIQNCIFWNNPNSEEDPDKEILYFPYSEVEFHKSTINLKNCIVQKGEQYSFFSKSCFSKEPLFVDTAALNLIPSWKSYPLNDQYKSIAIDNGDYMDPSDPDSSRSDIGAIAYYNAQRQKLPRADFIFREVPGIHFNEFQFVNQSINAKNVDFTWDFGDGTTSTAANPVHTYAKNGLYTVKLIMEDKAGLRDSLTVYDALNVLVGQRVLQGSVEGIWKKALSPYYIHGNLTVAAGKKLEIEPGVQVKFMGPYNLDIMGSMVAIGTSKDTISFGAFDTTGMALNKEMNIDYPAGTFQPGKGWGGIHMLSDSTKNDSCLLRYVKMSDVRTGENNIQVYQGALKLYNIKKADIENCYFLNNLMVPTMSTDWSDSWPRLFQNAGIHGLGTSAVIKNNRFENIYQIGPAAIYLANADSVLIRDNLFYNLSATAIGLDRISHYSIDHNIFDSVSGLSITINDLIPKSNIRRLNQVVYNSFSNSANALYAGKSGNGLRNILIAYNTIHHNQSFSCAGFQINGDSIYLVNNLFYENANTGVNSSFIGTCINMDLVGGKYGVIANNSFVDNIGTPYQPIVAGAREVKIYNNILQDLYGAELVAKIFVEYEDRLVPFDSVYNNDVKGNYPAENGNIDVDPGFINKAKYNFKLAATSPLINKGSIDISGLHLTDMDYWGQPRLDSFIHTVDIGANEFQPEKPGESTLSNDSVLVKMLPGTKIGEFKHKIDLPGYQTTYELIDTVEDNQDFTLIDNVLSTATIFKNAEKVKLVALRATNNFGGIRDAIFKIYLKDNLSPERPFGIQLSNNEIQAGSANHTIIGQLTSLDASGQLWHEYSIIGQNRDNNGDPIFQIMDNSLYAGVTLPDTPSLRSVTIRTTNKIGEYYDSTFQIKVIPVKTESGDPVFAIFPNPFNTQICIAPDKNNQQGRWKILSLDGRALLSGNYKGKTYIKLSGLPSGMYFLKIDSGNYQRQFKIIKK